MDSVSGETLWTRSPRPNRTRRWVSPWPLRISSMEARGHCEASASLTLALATSPAHGSRLCSLPATYTQVRNSFAHQTYNHMVAFKMCTAASALRLSSPLRLPLRLSWLPPGCPQAAPPEAALRAPRCPAEVVLKAALGLSCRSPDPLAAPELPLRCPQLPLWPPSGHQMAPVSDLVHEE
jgi:hypothetical protein